MYRNTSAQFELSDWTHIIALHRKALRQENTKGMLSTLTKKSSTEIRYLPAKQETNGHQADCAKRDETHQRPG